MNFILSAASEGQTDSPFLVLDLIYVYSLLHHGYHIEDQTKVHVSSIITLYIGTEVLKTLFKTLMISLEELGHMKSLRVSKVAQLFVF